MAGVVIDSVGGNADDGGWEVLEGVMWRKVTSGASGLIG
jgi:hypothetical protein